MFYLKKLHLTDFRCHKDLLLQFSPAINILVGRNACGKTSIVEAVHCLAFGKSYKVNLNTDIIRKGTEYSQIKAEVINRDKTDDLVLIYNAKTKRIILNNKPIARLSDYLGYFNVVVFCPEDYRLIRGAPRDRRTFFDANISQLSKRYLNALMSYRKILKQRNEILKSISEKRGLDRTLFKVITEQLIKEAKIIVFERHKFIDNINPFFSEKAQKISGCHEKGMIIYSPNTAYDQIESIYNNAISQEIALQTTLFGPHRDDFTIQINNEKAGSFASQGQQKTLLLAIKLALSELLEKEETPLIIILDDVFSELDAKRQNQILQMINKQKQIFITTTSIQSLTTKLTDCSNIIKVNKEEHI